MPRFVDTNVLLYAISSDARDEAKRTTARALLRERDLVLSTQVLGEFVVQATRTTRSRPASDADAAAFVETLLHLPIQPITVPVVTTALAMKAAHGISFWDAQILAAARAAGCGRILTEDLNAGQDYDGVVAVNPFA